MEKKPETVCASVHNKSLHLKIELLPNKWKNIFLNCLKLMSIEIH